jgi:hypothetical protein
MLVVAEAEDATLGPITVPHAALGPAAAQPEPPGSLPGSVGERLPTGHGVMSAQITHTE